MDLGFEGGWYAHPSALSVHELGQEGINLGAKAVYLPATCFRTVFANDILPAAALAWRRYFSSKGHLPEVYRLESLVDLVRRHRAGEKVFPERIDIVTGGFPCQDFSVAGKRRGFSSHKNHLGVLDADISRASEESRGKLYMWMKEVIDIVRPKVFVAENVKGLVSLEDVHEVIKQDFSRVSDDGYIVLSRVLRASDYGVAQSRERVLFIGFRRSALKAEALQALEQAQIPLAYDPYPRPTHGSLKRPYTSVGEILSSLEEPDKSTDPSQMYYSKAKYMGKHCQGQSEVHLDGLAPTIRAEHHGNIEYRRLSLDHGGRYADEFLAGAQERRLSPRECALIQSFPQEYDFVIPQEGRSGRFALSPSMAYKIIGNAVPPLMAYRLARRLEELWGDYFID